MRTDPGRTRPWKVAVATLIGTSVEWYDYGIYGFAAAVVFPTVFFPTMSPPVAVLASFATLAIGSLGRPLGAVIFGHIGDRLGRRRSLVLSLVLMGAMTVVIGLLPGYSAIGAAAPVLLLCVRILQSLAVGGEWGGALLFAVESAPRRRRALFGSFTQMGSGLGYFLATGAFGLVGLLGDRAVLEWAWRLPFLASAVLIVTGLVIRSQLSETAEFERVRETGERERIPLFELLRDHWLQTLLAVGAFLVPIGGFYIIVNFISAYAADTLSIGSGDIATAGMVASIVSVVFTPVAALAADRFGVRTVTLIGLALHVVAAAPMFLLLDLGTPLALILSMSLGMFVSTIAYAPVGTLVAGWFPAPVRQSGVSLSYQVAGVLGGGVVPVLAQALAIRGGGWPPVAVLFAGMAAVSLLGVVLKRGPGYLSFGDRATREAEELSAGTR